MTIIWDSSGRVRDNVYLLALLDRKVLQHPNDFKLQGKVGVETGIPGERPWRHTLQRNRKFRSEYRWQLCKSVPMALCAQQFGHSYLLFAYYFIHPRNEQNGKHISWKLVKNNKKQTQTRQRLQSLTLKPVFVIIKRWTFISKEICRPRKPWGRIQYKYSWKNLARQKHSGISWMQLVPLSHTNASGALTNVNKNDLRCGGIFLYLHFVAKGSSNWL